MKFIASLILICAIAFSQEKPTWQDIQKVVNYKENGDAAILYQHQITSKIDKMNPVDNLEEVSVDSTAFIWLKFLVPPKIEDKNFTVVVRKGPIPKKTQQLTLKTRSEDGALVYRTYVTYKFKDKGEHFIDIYFKETLVQNIKINALD